MEDFRCKCSKLIVQMTEREVIIKCRHCKRYIIINTQGIGEIEYANNIYPKMFAHDKKILVVL